MKADDLRRYQDMLRERGELLRFSDREFRAKHIGIFIPTLFDVASMRRGETSQTIFINDAATIGGIMALALPAVKTRISEIEKELAFAGVEFSAPSDDEASA